jgi:hypothetical protein
VAEYVAKPNIPVICPSFSPSLVPCDLLIFSKLKDELQGKIFENKEDVIESAVKGLRAVVKE